MRSGDLCPSCGAQIQVVNTRIIGTQRVRYLGCRSCGYRPVKNKIIIPLEYAPPRVATSSTQPHRPIAQLG